MRIYTDGVLQNINNSLSGTLPTNSYNMWIGRNYDSTNETGYFNGTIDEIRIWNKSLSTNEIQ